VAVIGVFMLAFSLTTLALNWRCMSASQKWGAFGGFMGAAVVGLFFAPGFAAVAPKPVATTPAPSTAAPPTVPAPSTNWNPSQAGHIFRSAPGHVNPTFAASQARFANLFKSVSSNPANLRPDLLSPSQQAAGVQMFTQMFKNGQVWVQVRAGQIINAGVNPPGSAR
jgi:hypothetical protein